MNVKPKILALSGSTRKMSSNLTLIKTIAQLSVSLFEVEIFDGIATLPHFNSDDDHENPPMIVAEFRSKVRQADGVLVCTPEYALGVPGTLRNAFDWTVSSKRSLLH